ncbi:MAG TPA: hypothetical protein VFF76_00315 [Holophagaceae bacterium]|nr:hypothetical protein [Holophagaceae bacterium]
MPRLPEPNWITFAQAAHRIGVSWEAIADRVKRRTLTSKEFDGVRMVLAAQVKPFKPKRR